VQKLLARATDPARPAWQRVALLEGMGPPPSPFAFPAAGPPAGRARARAAAFGRGRGGPRLALPAAPAALLALAESPDTVLGPLAQGVAAALDWPGKPEPAGPETRPLSPEERQRFEQGRQIFAGVCAACHQADGQGLPGVAKSLVGSRWALAPAPQVIRIVLHGKEGEMLMPPIGGSMSDEQIAAVLTYVRRSWGNTALPIDPAEVTEARGSTTGRKRAWSEEELARVRR
jgi:mono/diheme cytochrome c family protein